MLVGRLSALRFKLFQGVHNRKNPVVFGDRFLTFAASGALISVYRHRNLRMSKISADTPLMQQHRAIKQKYPDAILLFRVGDFYETFGEDAIHASRILGI